MDLDRFQSVNDVFGHAMGDALLREVARRLEAACQGAFFARLGGDEFAVITSPGSQPAAAEARVLSSAQKADIFACRIIAILYARVDVTRYNAMS